jgi:hypothetical protein
VLAWSTKKSHLPLLVRVRATFFDAASDPHEEHDTGPELLYGGSSTSFGVAVPGG